MAATPRTARTGPVFAQRSAGSPSLAAIEESIRFANAALAAAGHDGARPECEQDIRSALRGEISFADLADRAAARASR